MRIGFRLESFAVYASLLSLPAAAQDSLCSAIGVASAAGLSPARHAKLCLAHIAKMLGFSAIRYKSGAFFNRNADKESPGYQIDLIFERADHVFTICEIRYLQAKVDTSIIEEFERKLVLLANPKKHSIEKVLISAEGATEALIARGYFDRVITLEDFFNF